MSWVALSAPMTTKSAQIAAVPPLSWVGAASRAMAPIAAPISAWVAIIQPRSVPMRSTSGLHKNLSVLSRWSAEV